MKCLITNKVCPLNNKKCKECEWYTCKKALDKIETQQEKEYRLKRKEIIKQLPEQCKNCSFLEIIDLYKKIVRCPYMVKHTCMIEKKGGIEMIQWNNETLENPDSVAQILVLAEKEWNKRRVSYLEQGGGEKYINTILVGYFAGKEPVYNVENIFNKEQQKDEESKFLINYISKYNDDAKEFYDLAFEYFSMKACYEILYENSENEIIYAKQSALNTIGIFDYSAPVNQIGQLRKWEEKNEENRDITIIELTAINGKRYYTPIEEDTNKLKELKQRREKSKWNMLPCIAIENEIGLSSSEIVLMLNEEKNFSNLGLINLCNNNVCDRDFFFLEQIVTSADKMFKKAILKRWEIIIDRLNRRKNKQYDFRNIKIDLYRNINF